jgi:hypothetical protein
MPKCRMAEIPRCAQRYQKYKFDQNRPAIVNYAVFHVASDVTNYQPSLTAFQEPVKTGMPSAPIAADCFSSQGPGIGKALRGVLPFVQGIEQQHSASACLARCSSASEAVALQSSGNLAMRNDATAC